MSSLRAFSYIRCSLAALLLMAVTLPVLLWGCLNSLAGVLNNPVMWLPVDFEARRQFEWFITSFGTADMVVVSWDDCSVNDPRLRKFAEDLASPRWNEYRVARTQLTGDVLDGYTAVRQLMEAPVNLSRGAALKRLRGSLVGRDGQTSCTVIAVTWRGQTHQAESIEFIRDRARTVVGVGDENIHLAGSAVEGLAIDAESSRSFNYFGLPSALLSLILCQLCLKSWRLTLAVLAAAGFGGVMVMGLTYFGGVTMNAILVVMAPLVFVLAVSSGVHLVNYFRDEVRFRGSEGAVRRALAAGWWPCTLAAVTTAIGVGSLMVSDMIPIRQFGLFASIGVLATVGLLFLVIPGAMQWESRRIKSSTIGEPDASHSDRFWPSITAILVRFKHLIVVVGLTLLGISIYGLTSLESSVNVRNLLVPNHRLMRDYRWFEENLGPLVPVEVVLEFPAECELDILKRVELMRRVERKFSEIQTLDGIVSAATFVPNIPRSGGARQTMRRAVIRSRLRQSRSDLIASHWLYEEGQREWWRISARVQAFGDIDYGQFLDELRERVDDVLKDEQYEGISATFTGTAPVVYQAQRVLLNDLGASFMTAIVLVATAMILVFRNVAGGLVAMIPNVFPSIVLFGLMGLWGVKVDIGAVMTASVALGIAVDDTIHFLTWFRRGLQRGLSHREAISFAFRHCAVAMIQTSMICGLGLLVFTLSGFLPTQRFAWMMFALLTAALVGVFVLLPALLAGPLGKAFPQAQAPVECPPDQCSC